MRLLFIMKNLQYLSRILRISSKNVTLGFTLYIASYLNFSWIIERRVRLAGGLPRGRCQGKSGPASGATDLTGLLGLVCPDLEGLWSPLRGDFRDLSVLSRSLWPLAETGSGEEEVTPVTVQMADTGAAGVAWDGSLAIACSQRFAHEHARSPPLWTGLHPGPLPGTAPRLCTQPIDTGSGRKYTGSGGGPERTHIT